MSAEEAQKVLQLKDGAPWAEVVQRYRHMYGVNASHGSHYLLSKVYRAGERLEQDYNEAGLRPADAPSVVQGTAAAAAEEAGAEEGAAGAQQQQQGGGGDKQEQGKG
jgi:import inner membrane translocase subunit TIM16